MMNNNFKSDTMKKALGLYLHVPFCVSKCAYCDFYSFVPTDGTIKKRYTDALCSHMESYRDGLRDYAPNTVYIGGGTPTSLEPDELIRIVKAARHNFDIDKNAEFTIEANPATVSLETLKRLRRLGVSRLSLGLQSADNRELRALSRIHTRQQFEKSFTAARDAKFDNISVDLMFGIMGQTKSSLMRSLDYVTSLDCEHISLYNLKLEPGTPLHRRREQLLLPDEDEQYDMYLSAIKFLGERGYRQYEISNFSKPRRQSKHNLKYWNCDEYLGLGASAHSYLGDRRFSFIADVEKYIAGASDIYSDVKIIDEDEMILPQHRVGEYIMLQLRLCRGIDNNEFQRRFGRDFIASNDKKLTRFIADGYMKKRGDSIALTPKGMFVSNYIISDLI